MKYKIVDTFNGGTFGKFNSVEAATRELDKQRRRFRSSLSTANATFCREIAPADRAIMRVHIESSYHPGRGYRIDGASKNVQIPRCRWFRTISEMLCAIERLNPEIEIV